MSERKRKLIHLFYDINLAVFAVNAALHLILACYAIYDGANAEFSREMVATQFSKIAVPVFVFIIGVIGGIILSIALPLHTDENALLKKRNASVKNYSMIRERIAKKVDVTTCDEELGAAIIKERRLRLISTIVCITLCAVAAIPMLIFICNPANYDKYLINESIIPAVTLMLIWCVLAFIYCLALSVITRVSLKAEIELLRDAIAKKDGVQPVKEAPVNPKKELIVTWSIRGAILAVAVAFIVIGIVNGGMGDVLGKAIRLCTECIGLG